MRRFVGLCLVVAAAAGAAAQGPPPGSTAASKSPTHRALTADVVVVGRVTAVEKDAVDVALLGTAQSKVQYRVAVVKVGTPLAGAAGLADVRVGFIPPPPPAPAQPGPAAGKARGPVRRPGAAARDLKEDEEYLLFLVKHPAGFYAMPDQSPPVPAKGHDLGKEAELLKKVFAVTADPVKALTADAPADRAFAAAVLVTKYRSVPDRGREPDEALVPAEESRLILRGLAGADWARFDRNLPNGMQAYFQLGLGAKDGWAMPQPQPGSGPPGQQAAAFSLIVRDAFAKWVDGPGKDYRVKRYVPKK